jgi:AcrR family transcriptional regulator
MRKQATESEAIPQADAAEPDRFSAYLDLGRKNQKLRTRDALVSVAADLIRKGQPISVTDVADAARVSRTTAYRYFPTTEMLAAQATLAAADVAESRELDRIAAGPGTPAEKLDAIIAGSHAMTTAHQTALRSLLRFTVEAGAKDDVPHRPSFRRTWIEGVLAPLRKELGPKRFARLTGALCLLCGIEAIVVLSDICRMPPDEAREAKRWAGQRLLQAAIDEAAQGRGTATKPDPARPSKPRSRA